MSCTVVIPTWNKARMLSDCLDSLHGADVLVVDNGSRDGTPGMLTNAGVRHIDLDDNEGFACACNVGAREANTDVVIFLNNDTLPTPGWWQAMASAVSVDRPIVGCHLTYPDGTTQHAGVVITKPGGTLVAVNITEPRPSREVHAVTGACMAVHRETFLAAGGFHEGYRNGYEDVDLCLTLGGAYYTADATVEHLESQTPGRFDHVAHNVQLLNERWCDRWPTRRRWTN